MNEALLQAINDVFGRPDVWLIIIASACYGIFVGAIPGLTATMAVALFVPMAYWLDPVSAVAAIVSMVACAIFAGDLPTVFLRIPGTPASAAYADDAYELAQSGQAQRLLGVALTCSVAGGIAGAIVLMLLGSQLAKVARWFSVTEYFWLYLIGLGCAVLVAPGGARWKAVLALLLGLLLSTVGLSAAHIEPRFTLGMPSLYQGISFIPAMIGLFGLSEVFTNLSSGPRRGMQAEAGDALSIAGTLRQIRSDAVFRIRHRKAASTRSSLLGVLIGMLPGAGADIAAWVAFAVAKRPASKVPASKVPASKVPASKVPASKVPASKVPASKRRRRREAIHAIGDASTANSSALAGGWIPTLVFGIPGDSVTAIVIGVLMMKNVTPGPAIFENQPALVYSIYLVFMLANLVMLPIGWLAIRLGARIVRIPKPYLLPVIVLFCVTGSYALNGSLVDVTTMLVMGLVGYGLSRYGYPLGPVVLGLVLGGPLEERLIQSLTAAGGSPLGLVDRPIAILLAVVAASIAGGVFIKGSSVGSRYSDREAGSR